MTKILVLGDTHGNLSWTQAAIRRTANQGITTIVQVGDFGYWEHEPDGVKFLDVVSETAVENLVDFYWLDGNHDNHVLLWGKYPGAEYRDATDFIKIRERLFYIPRGFAWEWDGIKMLALGGAVSIDKAWRTPGESWWPTEVTTEDQAQTAMNRGKVDVFFTHDCPNEFMGACGRQLIPNQDSMMNRHVMSRVAAVVTPKVWFHGHMHQRLGYGFRHENGWTIVEGLACDGMDGASFVLNTEDVVPSEKPQA